MALVKKMAGIKVVEEENVPETNAVQKTMQGMIAQDGATLLFPTSFGYFDPHMLAQAAKNPGVPHKYREVTEHADDVSVLPRGALVASVAVADTTPQALAQAMVGEGKAVALALSRDPREAGAVHLAKAGLQVLGDRGEAAVQPFDLQVRAGEIVGVAGVSGNGQRELMQSLTGQRPRKAGSVQVAGQHFTATRGQNRRLKVRALPEEPLLNACVGELSVSHNMGLRQFDESPYATHAATGGWVRWGRLRQRARAWIADFGVRTQGERAAMRTLSGGNVQRAVLARELAGEAALLLVSEDLDELLLLADRIVVMSAGRIVHDVPAHLADRRELGAFMGGKGHAVPHPAGAALATQAALTPEAA